MNRQNFFTHRIAVPAGSVRISRIASWASAWFTT